MAFEIHRACGVVAQHLLHGCAEVVVQRRALPYTDVLAAPFGELIHLRLQDDTHTLHQEHPAKDRQEQLLVDNHGAHTYNAAYGEAARVAHEDLRRETVPPEEAYQRTHECRKKHYQFLAARDVHHIEIVRKHHIATDIRQYDKCRSDNRRVARTHSVHAVVEVGSVAHGCHHEYRQQHEKDPARFLFVGLAEPREHVGVVAVVRFHKGYGGAGGLDIGGFLHHLDVVLDA